MSADLDSISMDMKNAEGIISTSNVGSGFGLALSVESTDAPFKSIIAGDNVTITQTSTDITIEVGNASQDLSVDNLTLSGSIIFEDGSTQVRGAALTDFGWDVDFMENFISGSFSSTPVPTSFFIKLDGTKLFMLDGGNPPTVDVYTLSTAWDASSISFDGAASTGSLTENNTLSKQIVIRNDGLKLYALNQSLTVFEYDLVSPWVVKDMVYSGNSYSFDQGGEEDFPVNFYIKPDGTTLFMIGTENDSIYQYTFGTQWDLSTLSYDSVSASLLVTTPNAVWFREDGRRFYVQHLSTEDTIQENILTTPWDISTLESGGSFTINNVTWGYSIVADQFGLSLYALDVASNKIIQYAFGFSTEGTVHAAAIIADGNISCDTISFTDLTTQSVGVIPQGITHFPVTILFKHSQDFTDISPEPTPGGCHFKPDGTVFYTTNRDDANIVEMPLVIPWDVTSYVDTTGTSTDLAVASASFSSVFIKPSDGKTAFIADRGNNKLYEYSLGTDWSFTGTNTLVDSLDLPNTSTQQVTFHPDGKTVYALGAASPQTLTSWALDVAWSLADATVISTKLISELASLTLVVGVSFTPDGKNIIFADTTNRSIYRYALGIAWDISSSYTLIESESIVSETGNDVRNIFIPPDGVKFYVVSESNTNVIEYDMGIKTDGILDAATVNAIAIAVTNTSDETTNLNGDYIEIPVLTFPAAPASGDIRLYAEDGEDAPSLFTIDSDGSRQNLLDGYFLWTAAFPSTILASPMDYYPLVGYLTSVNITDNSKVRTYLNQTTLFDKLQIVVLDNDCTEDSFFTLLGGSGSLSVTIPAATNGTFQSDSSLVQTATEGQSIFYQWTRPTGVNQLIIRNVTIRGHVRY